jgi:hypothetical protein
MKKKLSTLILAGAFLTTVIGSALAAPQGKMSGQTQQSGNPSGTQIQDQQRLRDGSCTDPAQTGSKTKKGKAYGPGDGTGYDGFGPGDGTGFGEWPW